MRHTVYEYAQWPLQSMYCRKASLGHTGPSAKMGNMQDKVELKRTNHIPGQIDYFDNLVTYNLEIVNIDGPFH